MDPCGTEHEPVVVEQTGNFNIVAKLDSDFELLTHNVASAELYRDIWKAIRSKSSHSWVRSLFDNVQSAPYSGG